MTDLDIVIVNWNSGDLLRRCIDSLIVARTGIKLGLVCIVDNASVDRSQYLQSNSALPIQIVQNLSNIGFSAACNLGAFKGQSKYILFLNPDTELNATSLSAPLSLMESPENGKIAICGIQMVDKDGSPAPSVSVFPTPARFLCKAIGLSTLFPVKCASVLLPAGYPANSGVVDQVIGAFMLVRRRVFEELSGFDERFFVYHEDVDISLRAKKAGYESFFLREACAFHRGHGSSENVKAARLFYVLRGRILYSAKHFSSAGHALTVFLTLAIEPVSRLAKAAASLSLAGIRQTLSGYIKLYCWLLSRHRGSRSA